MKPLDQSPSPSHPQDDPQKDMAALIRALETPPTVHVSADFATRVLQRLPAERQRSLRPGTPSGSRAPVLTPRFGIGAAVLAVVALLALFAIVPGHMAPTSLQTCTEMLLSAQFLGIVLWLGIMRWHPR